MTRNGLVLLALVCCGCGPTERDSGQAVLLAAPFITLAGAALCTLFVKLWRPLEADCRFSWWPTHVTICVQCLLCLGVIVAPPGTGEWLLVALLFLGASYVTTQLVLLRLMLRTSLQKHLGVLTLAPWFFFYPPALAMSYWGSATLELQAFPGLLWVLPGYGGFVLVPVFSLLLVEVLIRRKRQADRQRDESMPRPLPQARARFR